MYLKYHMNKFSPSGSLFHFSSLYLIAIRNIPSSFQKQEALKFSLNCQRRAAISSGTKYISSPLNLEE